MKRMYWYAAALCQELLKQFRITYYVGNKVGARGNRFPYFTLLRGLSIVIFTAPSSWASIFEMSIFNNLLLNQNFPCLLCRWTSWSLRRRYGQIQLLLCVDTPGRPRCRMVPQWRQSRSSPARTDPILEKEVRQTRNWIWWEAFLLKIAIGFVQEFDSYSICGIARRRAVVDPSQEHPIDGPGTENDSLV